MAAAPSEFTILKGKDGSRWLVYWPGSGIITRLKEAEKGKASK
jgi:hypothetical protein